MRSRFTWACFSNAAIAFCVGLYAILSAQAMDELRINQGLVFWAMAVVFLAIWRIFRRKPVRNTRRFEVILQPPESQDRSS